MARVMTLFPALGEDGRRRAQRIRRLAESIGYGYREETDYTVRGGMRAQFCDDVVVYDLSGNDDTDGPYRALVSTYMHCDHVLLISRDYLPLNLLPRRPGGAPPYPYPLEHLPDGHKVRYPAFNVRGEQRGEWVEKDDHSMMTWLREQLEDLATAPVGPRLPRAGSDSPLWSVQPATVNHLRSLTNAQRTVHLTPTTAFLSYRGRHYDAALRLADRVADGGIAGSRARNLRVVSPSEFAIDGELMPAGRRWMVVEYLSLLIQDSYEFWVYRTDDYLNSWWTLAELVCFARSADRATHGRIGSAPAMRTVDPVSGRLSDQPGTLRIPLRRRERKQIDGITVFTAPGVSSTASRTLEGRSKPPRGAVRDRSWSSFWNDLLIDRRALTDGDQPYQPSAQALLDGVNDMVVVHPAAAAAAVATDGLVRAEDGSRWRLAELPQRLLYDRPLSTRPDLPVLSKFTTYHVLR
jgi:hypothetical protein